VTALTLIEFLLARIAEDEKVAREAVTDGWVVHEYPYEGTSITGYEREDYEGALSAVGAHIEAHSPARVLAECDAKRSILKFHESWPVLAETPPGIVVDPSDLSGMTVRATQQIAWLTTQEYRARFGDEPTTTPILAALALPYRDHPDYDGNWG